MLVTMASSVNISVKAKTENCVDGVKEAAQEASDRLRPSQSKQLYEMEF